MSAGKLLYTEYRFSYRYVRH